MDQVEAFNSLPTGPVMADLLACCAAPDWGAAILAGRPYSSRGELLQAAEAAVRGLNWAQVLAGLSAHPRIGERAAGDSREAAWSRREQAVAAQDPDDETTAALVRANRAYEQRFGYVFLIFASGRSSGEILAAAVQRVHNDEATERVVVAGELGRIAALRLGKVLDALG